MTGTTAATARARSMQLLVDGVCLGNSGQKVVSMRHASESPASNGWGEVESVKENAWRGSTWPTYWP
jgi:hypothetical protein